VYIDIVNNSIHEISNSTVHIFPNPATHAINIYVEGSFDFKAMLYDLNERVIDALVIKTSIETASLPAGIYLLELKDRKSVSRTIKRAGIER
jgi:hypothetical protein